MLQDVLSIRSPELQLTKQLEHFFGDTNHANLAHSILACLFDFFFDLLFSLCNDFFDAGWMNSPIFHQHFKRNPRNLSPNRIKARQDNHARRIINKNIDTRFTLKGLNISPLFADNSPLHFFVFKLDSGNSSFGSDITTYSLHSCQQYHLS